MYEPGITDPKSLSVASLIIYIILIQPVTYCLWRHGKRGILGWICLHSLCIIRIIGGGVELHAENNHSTGGLTTIILQSVGLSPLLLSATGILHEARLARRPDLHRKLEWFLVIQYHLIVVAGIALVIIGIVKLQGGASVGTLLMKVGTAAIIACWVILAAWTLLSFPSTQSYTASGIQAEGTKLLHGVAAVLPLIALREIFAAGSTYGPSSGFTSSLALKICLSVIPEMLSVAILTVFGLRTRRITNMLQKQAR